MAKSDWVSRVLGHVYVAAMLPFALLERRPKSRVAEAYPERATPVARFEPGEGAEVPVVAVFHVVSAGERLEKVRDGFGLVPGEIPMPGVLRAREGETFVAHVRVRFEGVELPAADHPWHYAAPHGFRVTS